MVEAHIRTIVQNLTRLAESSREDFSSTAAIAASAASASSSRAALQRSQLGAAARHTVAASATSLLGSYLKGGRNDDRIVRDMLKSAFALGAARPPRHVPRDCEAPVPEGWTLLEDGSLSRRSHLGREHRITHDPAKPGGDWTLSVDGLPVASGEGPDELARTALAVEVFIRGPQSFRRATPV